MLAAALLALAGTGQFLYQQDMETQKNRFEIEALAGVPITEKTECAQVAKADIAQCRLVVYQLGSLSTSLRLFLLIYNFLFYGGTFLVALSGLTYFGYALKRESE